MDLVDIETSIVSHATARPSSDPATAVLLNQAKRWIDEQASNYELVTPQWVIDEAGDGNTNAASRRLAMLASIPLIPANPDAHIIADAIVSHSMMPVSARLDALHVATAALAGVLTQNCKHISHAHELPRVYRLLDDFGLSGMLICTPVEFLGGSDDDE